MQLLRLQQQQCSLSEQQQQQQQLKPYVYLLGPLHIET
jgi:hypothetical protein